MVVKTLKTHGIKSSKIFVLTIYDAKKCKITKIMVTKYLENFLKCILIPFLVRSSKCYQSPSVNFFFMKIMKKYLTEVLICHYHYHTRKLFD
jgi:hypothetical protein